MNTLATKYDRLAEQLFSCAKPRLSEDNSDGTSYPDSERVELSEAIVVNGNHFIPAHSTLIIERPTCES